MSCMVLLELQVKPESVNEMKALLSKILPQTRDFAGCMLVELYGNLEDTGDLVFHEHWESRAHYERYLAWRSETGGGAAMMDMLAGPPKLRFFDRLGC